MNACKREWRNAIAPNLETGPTTGRLRACEYCGSMHPADVAEAIRRGASGSFADFKYGWPHKAYFERIPNPHAGMLESLCGHSHGVPECPTTGELCRQGAQSFYHPKCECMKDAPETVHSGRDDFGKPLIAVPTGMFNPSSGKPQKDWRAPGEPAAPTTWGKFYTIHLQDATPEDRKVIERHLGIHFEFNGDSVSWFPYSE